MLKRKKTITILLLLIALFSLFSGFSLNGQWAWPFELAFFETPRIWKLFLMGKMPENAGIITLSIHSVTTILFIIFPFIYDRIIGFFKWLLIVGLIFLAVQFELASIFAIIFLPLVIVWIITLIHIRKMTATE